jgi:hypothetical protein
MKTFSLGGSVLNKTVFMVSVAPSIVGTEPAILLMVKTTQVRWLGLVLWWLLVTIITPYIPELFQSLLFETFLLAPTEFLY